jgi:Sulfotransferase family
LQSVYPAAWVYGGPGRFAFHPEAHLTEASALVSEGNRAQLLREWGAYYDLNCKVLLEKSPPNLIWSRFLQALFPGAGFIFIVRHPIPVSLATLRWAKTSVPELLAHWAAAHRMLLDDLAMIDRVAVLRYEDFVADAARWLAAICCFAGLSPLEPAESVEDHNRRYLALWDERRDAAAEAQRQLAAADRQAATLFARFGYSLAKPYVADWQTPEPHDLLGAVGRQSCR